jgi:hypothetical protein
MQVSASVHPLLTAVSVYHASHSAFQLVPPPFPSGRCRCLSSRRRRRSISRSVDHNRSSYEATLW